MSRFILPLGSTTALKSLSEEEIKQHILTYCNTFLIDENNNYLCQRSESLIYQFIEFHLNYPNQKQTHCEDVNLAMRDLYCELDDALIALAKEQHLVSLTKFGDSLESYQLATHSLSKIVFYIEGDIQREANYLFHERHVQVDTIFNTLYVTRPSTAYRYLTFDEAHQIQKDYSHRLSHDNSTTKIRVEIPYLPQYKLSTSGNF